ncbi:MAG: hypothetical protein IPM16_17305 [Chloroflexi bacterium]|nr:hypothetical protein [Chloroflexota bacterium]
MLSKPSGVPAEGHGKLFGYDSLHWPDGRYLFAGPSYADVLGWTLEALNEPPLDKIVAQEDRAALLRQAHATAVNGATVPVLRYRLISRDGQTVVPVTVAAQPILDAAGSTIAIVKICRASTAKLGDLPNDTRSMAALIEHVLHELSNPLSVILSSVELLESHSRQMPDDRLAEHADRIGTNAVRLQQALDVLTAILGG